MSRNEWIKRYVVFGLGLIICAMGVAFITKADLGTSPATAIPYTLSLRIYSVSLGNWTILFSILQIVAQIVMLKKEIRKSELVIQFVLACIFGYFIDFFMWLLGDFCPDTYIGKLCSLLAGCFLVSFGACLEVIADVAMLAGDAFIKAITVTFHTEYGITRIVSDVVMTIVAGILCMAFFHKLVGVREGTIVAALIVGFMIRVLLRKMKGIMKYLAEE